MFPLLQYAQIPYGEPVVHLSCGDVHADSGISGDTQPGQSSVEVTSVEPETAETDALFYNVSNTFEGDSVLQTAMYDMPAVELAIAEIERLCLIETQQWESDCSGADLSVLHSFSADMPLPDDADMVMHGQVVPEDAYGTEVADRDRLAHIVHVSSAFGSLMSDLLVSRPDLAYAVGAFAVGVVSRAMTDTGIVHCGAMQVVTRYLHQECHRGSSPSGAHVAFTLERLQMHSHIWSEPVGIG